MESLPRISTVVTHKVSPLIPSRKIEYQGLVNKNCSLGSPSEIGLMESAES